MKSKRQTSQADIEWKNRTLCSDGNCIGVIGPDGCCKECGRPFEGDLPATLTENETAVRQAPPETVTPPEVPVETEPRKARSATTSDEEWENRRLCVDGNCIGVIGPDGKCKECGRPDKS